MPSRIVLAPSLEADETTPVEARGVLSLLNSLRPGRSWATRAGNLYMAVMTVAVLVGVFWTASKGLGALLVDVARFYHFLWGPAAILLVFLAAFRYSTVQGFVSFSEPDCLYLLPAPLRRRDLVRPRLAAATVIVGIVGAIVGMLVVAGSAGSHSAGRVAGAAVAGLALGIVLVAGGWHIQRLRWATLWTMRLTLPTLGLVVLLAVAQDSGHVARLVALWSGPWGWAILPLVSDSPPYAIAGLALLCALALVAGISLLRTAGRCSTESFRSRARTRSQVVAGLYALDYRSVGMIGRGEKARTWQGRLRLRAPRRPSLAIPWHGAVALLRSPVRLGWSVLLAGAGPVLLALQPTRQGAVWAGAVALYLSASSLLEPLRLEVDCSGAPRTLLPWRFERVLWQHCLLPAGVMVVSGLLSLAIAAGLGYLTLVGAAVLAMLIIPLSFVVVLAAALSARRGGRVSSNMVDLAAMDTTGFSVPLVVVWLAIWAILAVVLTGVIVTMLGRSGLAIDVRLLGAIGGLVILAAAMRQGLLMKQSPK